MRKALLAVLLSLSFAAAAEDDLSSRRDYSDNAQRDRPIACKQGDMERFPGKSLGEVFGADWPAQPDASSPGARSPARMVEPGPIRWPRGLDPRDSATVVAVLVDAEGKPLRAEILCSTRMGFDKSVRNHAMASRYEPAVIDGKPVTSVVVRVVGIRAEQKPRIPRPARS